MILDNYNYRYALVPYEVAVKLGLGWRKVTSDNMVLLNQSEVRELDGDTLEEKVTTCGGKILTAEEAAYLSKTTTFTRFKRPATSENVVPQMPLEPANPDNQVEDKPTPLPDMGGEDIPTTIPETGQEDIPTTIPETSEDSQPSPSPNKEEVPEQPSTQSTDGANQLKKSKRLKLIKYE